MPSSIRPGFVRSPAGPPPRCRRAIPFGTWMNSASGPTESPRRRSASGSAYGTYRRRAACLCSQVLSAHKLAMRTASKMTARVSTRPIMVICQPRSFRNLRRGPITALRGPSSSPRRYRDRALWRPSLLTTVAEARAVAVLAEHGRAMFVHRAVVIECPRQGSTRAPHER